MQVSLTPSRDTLVKIDRAIGLGFDLTLHGFKRTGHYSFAALSFLYHAFKPKHRASQQKRAANGRFESTKEAVELGYFDFSYFNPSQKTKRLEHEPRALLDMLKEVGVTSISSVGVKETPTVSMYAFRLDGILPSAILNGNKLKNYESDLTSLINLKNGRKVSITAPTCDWGNNAYLLEVTVPKAKMDTVTLEEMLSSKQFWSFKGDMVVPIGKSANGYLYVDISKLPHLMVAGTTGSGKSVAINTMILALMHRLSPQEVKFLIIDPKAVEFTLYKNSAYLHGSNIITDMTKAVQALNAVVMLMEERYKVFQNNKVKDIKSYNAIASHKIERTLVVIDELADLMDTNRDEVETLIGRLAQKARAAGIHLLLATQRPSTKVITGDIKANIDTRVSYRLKTATDSITILGEGGAEQLMGQGDGFISIGGLDKVRFKAPYISDENIKKILGN